MKKYILRLHRLPDAIAFGQLRMTRLMLQPRRGKDRRDCVMLERTQRAASGGTETFGAPCQGTVFASESASKTLEYLFDQY